MLLLVYFTANLLSWYSEKWPCRLYMDWMCKCNYDPASFTQNLNEDAYIYFIAEWCCINRWPNIMERLFCVRLCSVNSRWWPGQLWRKCWCHETRHHSSRKSNMWHTICHDYIHVTRPTLMSGGLLATVPRCSSATGLQIGIPFPMFIYVQSIWSNVLCILFGTFYQ